MSARDLLKLVWGNLGRMRARVAMTAIGVLVGTAAVVILISLAAGLQRSATQDLASIADLTQITVMPGSVVQAFGGPSVSQREAKVLNDRALADFKRLPHVVAVSPQVRLQGMATIKLNRLMGHASVVGVDPTQLEELGFKLSSGSLRLSSGQAIVGAKVGESFFDPIRRQKVEKLDLQDRAISLELTKHGQEVYFGGAGVVVRQPSGPLVRRSSSPAASKRIRLRVSGVLAERGESDYNLYLPLKDVLEMNEWIRGRRIDVNRESYETAIIKVDTPEQVFEVQKKIIEMGFFAFSFADALRSINIFFLALQAILGGIGAIALLVAAFGIANTMIMAIYERTREIGLMKAVGATNRDVMSVFLAEAASIGFIGGLVGVLLGVAVSRAINFFALNYLRAQAAGQGPSTIVHTPPWLPLFAIIFATLVGLVSGIYPSLRAATLDPVQALKYE